MNLVDSCGWLEYLADGPNAAFFEEALLDTSTLLVPSICIVEVSKRMWTWLGKEAALAAAAAMREGRVVDLDANLAWQAASLGLDLRLPLADSVILAIARQHQAVVWTQDVHFQGLPGVRCQPRP
jgi:predicted nucleic acid-binding protein